MPPEIFHMEPYNPFAADLYCCGVILFVMLMATFPYEMPTPDDNRFSHILSGRLRDLLKMWNLDHVVSSEAKDLLSGLLAYEPKRLTLQQVLNHPFVRAGAGEGGGAAAAAPRTAPAAPSSSTAVRGGGVEEAESKQSQQRQQQQRRQQQRKQIVTPGWFLAGPETMRAQVQNVTVTTLRGFVSSKDESVVAALERELVRTYHMTEDQAWEIIVYFYDLLKASMTAAAEK
mmetsp:Transcript_18666/g.37737  ORF Transcript_18666/g.37737 Transcript_18666/m.37737 type:complete len:230 (+) Transcript_18666:48-737(+)